MNAKEKDYRYEVAKVMIENGRIKTFPAIFTYLPKTIPARDLGMKAGAMNAFIETPGKYRLDKLLQLARLIGVEPEKVVALALKRALETTIIEGQRGDLIYRVETIRG